MRRKTLSFCCLALVMVLGTVPAWAAEEAEQDGGWFGVTARVVNFAILAGGLFYLLRKPLGNYLNARAEEIRQQLAEADKKRGQAAREKQRAEAQRAALDEEIARVRAQ
ncbi:MAG: ATP synthase F0 subunit B, partial [Acidobacteriota bacterium]